MAQWEHKDLQGLLDKMVLQEHKVHKVLKDHKEFLEIVLVMTL